MKVRHQVVGLSHDTTSFFPVSFCSKLLRLITPQRRNARIKGWLCALSICRAIPGKVCLSFAKKQQLFYGWGIEKWLHLWCLPALTFFFPFRSDQLIQLSLSEYLLWLNSMKKIFYLETAPSFPDLNSLILHIWL